jgi:hypothetical protein
MAARIAIAMLTDLGLFMLDNRENFGGNGQ